MKTSRTRTSLLGVIAVACAAVVFEGCAKSYDFRVTVIDAATEKPIEDSHIVHMRPKFRMMYFIPINEPFPLTGYDTDAAGQVLIPSVQSQDSLVLRDGAGVGVTRIWPKPRIQILNSSRQPAMAAVMDTMIRRGFSLPVAKGQIGTLVVPVFKWRYLRSDDDVERVKWSDRATLTELGSGVTDGVIAKLRQCPQ